MQRPERDFELAHDSHEAGSRARHPINERAQLAKRRHPNNCMNPMSGGTKEMVVAPYRARYTIYVTPASLPLLLPTFILSQLNNSIASVDYCDFPFRMNRISELLD